MPLSSLTVHNVRNIEKVEVVLGDGLNFFYGENGAGKTSVLEAIGYLGLGRSFKNRKHAAVIAHNQHELTVFGRLDTQRESIDIGVVRSRQASANRTQVNGQRVEHSSELAVALPLQWVDHNSLELLTGPPNRRRSFLDWLLFHVKHEFHKEYRTYHQALKQRNALLRRDKISAAEIQPWSDQLAVSGEALDRLRRGSLDEMVEAFRGSEVLLDFMEGKRIDLVYSPGWEANESLAGVLAENFGKDRLRGFTGNGPHRAELAFRCGKVDLADTLSRGQNKNLVYALYVAQVEVVARLSQRKVLLLLDDVPAELDSAGRSRIARWIESLNTQCCVTGIDSKSLTLGWSQNALDSAKMFHVKHGALEPSPLNGEMHDR